MVFERIFLIIQKNVKKIENLLLKHPCFIVIGLTFLG